MRRVSAGSLWCSPLAEAQKTCEAFLKQTRCFQSGFQSFQMRQPLSNAELPESLEKPMKSTVPMVPVPSLEHYSSELIGSKKTCPPLSKFIKTEWFSRNFLVLRNSLQINIQNYALWDNFWLALPITIGLNSWHCLSRDGNLHSYSSQSISFTSGWCSACLWQKKIFSHGLH